MVGVVRFGLVWNGMEHHVMVWYSRGRYGTGWYGMVQYDSVQNGTVSYGLIWFSRARYGTV